MGTDLESYKVGNIIVDLDAITRCINQIDWSKVTGGKRK